MTDLARFTGTTQNVCGLLDQQRKMRSQAQNKKRKTAESNPLPQHKQGERFVRGPIPCDWLHRALACGGKSGHLALALWWLAGMQRCNPIRLTRQVAREERSGAKTSAGGTGSSRAVNASSPPKSLSPPAARSSGPPNHPSAPQKPLRGEAHPQYVVGPGHHRVALPPTRPPSQ